MIEITELILPAFWASALINADLSGFSDEEESQLNQVLENYLPGYCVACSEESEFRWRHDATSVGVLACDCLTYTFHREK